MWMYNFAQRIQCVKISRIPSLTEALNPYLFFNLTDQMCPHIFRKSIFKSAQLWLQFFFTSIAYASQHILKWIFRHQFERLLARTCPTIFISVNLYSYPPASTCPFQYLYPWRLAYWVCKVGLKYDNTLFKLSRAAGISAVRRCSLLILTKSLRYHKRRIWNT